MAGNLKMDSLKKFQESLYKGTGTKTFKESNIKDASG